jgi:protein-tyrosine kinase
MKDSATLRQLVPSTSSPQSSTGSATQAPAPSRRPMKMGEILIARGKINEEQVAKVLATQQANDRRFGEIAVALGFVRREDVEQALALQFSHSPGDSVRSMERSALTPAVSSSSPFSEALRGLRSQLMMRWFDGTPGQTTLAVTSVDRGDGKSFVTANLGIIFSQLGERTLVIDADLRHSTQHRIFRLKNRMGLSGILSGRAGLDEICEIAEFPKLSVLPSGPQPPNPVELLSRDEFAQLLNELSGHYDVILIDTPSAQQAADALVIARRARGALIVSRRNRTKSPELAQLASILASSGITLLGTTLNEY